ncbi:MAG: hypothetical protein EOO15_12040 [Chitinophagaceae bacterium]|nr:MAG: hypothetical protein EOO15_12040 [Chitinophagaceae bacterium]
MKKLFALVAFLYLLLPASAQTPEQRAVKKEGKVLSGTLRRLAVMLPKNNPEKAVFLRQIDSLDKAYKSEAAKNPPSESHLDLLRTRAQQLTETLTQSISAQPAFRVGPPPANPVAQGASAPRNPRASTPAKSGSVDTTVTFDSTSFARYCSTWASKWAAKMIRPDERMKYQSTVNRISSQEPFRTNDLLEESAAGAVMAAGKEWANLGSLYIFDAAAHLPGHAATAANVGGLLRLMDAIPEALKVLLYARRLNPKSLVVTVQVGYCLLEYGDDKKAEYFFRQCIRQDAGFPPAHTGLAAVYYKRGKLMDTYEELLKGASVGFKRGRAQTASELKQSCGFGLDEEDGANAGDFDYERAKDAINSASRYITVSNATVTTQHKVLIPQFPPFLSPADYCASGPALQYKLLNEAMEREQKMISTLRNSRPGDENPEYATEDFMFTSVNDIYEALAKKIAGKYRKEKLLLEERAQKELEQYNKTWSANYQDCLKKCTGASSDKCMKDCFCTAMMDTWHKHRDDMKNLFQQWKSLTINFGDDLQKLQNEYYEATGAWMDRVYDKPLYERMDLTRAGFSNTLVKHFALALNFTSYFCEGQDADMDAWCAGGYDTFNPKFVELEKQKANKPPECPKDKSLQLTILKTVSVTLDCESAGVEYFNSKVPTSQWVGGKYNWKKNQATAIIGVGASLSGLGTSGSAKVGVITVMDFTTNEVDGGLIAKLDYSSENSNNPAFKTGYSMEAKALILAGTEVNVSKTMTYDANELSVKYSSKSKAPAWNDVIY